MKNLALQTELARNKYIHITDFIDLFKISTHDITQFKGYWDNLILDDNFKSYTSRKRRILRYHYQPGQPLRINRDTHYKSSVTYDVDYTVGINKLTYAEDDFIAHPVMQNILATDITLLQNQLDDAYDYAIDIHPFRVIADSGNTSPTTSGIHQDGTDWVCMHFINSSNIHPVVSEIHASQEEAPPLLATAMHDFLETLIVDDKQLYHSAGEVRQLSAHSPAFRDILILTFRRRSKQEVAAAS